MENNTNGNKKKIFLFFYCDSYYNKKYIDEFTNNIFELLELDAFEDNVLKKKIANAINELFDIYKNIDNKEEIYKEYINNIMNKGKDDRDNESNNSSMNIDLSFSKSSISTKINRKRENSLMTIINSNKNFIGNIEMVKVNEYDTDLTMMFKANKYDNYYMKLKLYKKIKLINIIIFSLISIVLYSLIPFAIKNKH